MRRHLPQSSSTGQLFRALAPDHRIMRYAAFDCSPSIVAPCKLLSWPHRMFELVVSLFRLYRARTSWAGWTEGLFCTRTSWPWLCGACQRVDIQPVSRLAHSDRPTPDGFQISGVRRDLQGPPSFKLQTAPQARYLPPDKFAPSRVAGCDVPPTYFRVSFGLSAYGHFALLEPLHRLTGCGMWP